MGDRSSDLAYPVTPLTSTPGQAYPLTWTQHALLLGTLRRGPGYEVQQAVVQMEASIDARRLRDAWDAVVACHDVLRTQILWQDTALPSQTVLPSIQLPFSIHSTADIEAYLAADRALGFDLSKAPLFRLALIESPSHEATLVFTHHHLLLDGRSLCIVLDEALRHYAGRSHLAALQRPAFRDHCEAFAQRDRGAERAYFEHLLRDCSYPGLQPLPQTSDTKRAPDMVKSRAA